MAQKPAKTKKKPQTITDKATEQYQLRDPTSKQSLRTYFPSSNEVGAADLVRGQQPTTSTDSQKATSLIANTEIVRTNLAARTGNGQKPSNPKDALEALDGQDLLFGTSSQLVREESPTVLQNIQRAMRATEPSVDASRAKRTDDASGSPSARTSFAPLWKPTKSLWSAASRDSGGSLLETSFIDLSNHPCENESPAAAGDRGDKGSATPLPELHIPSAKPSISGSVETESSTIQHLPLDRAINTSRAIPRSLAEGTLRSRPKPKAKVFEKAKPRGKKATVSKDQLPDEMPKYETFTIGELAQAVAAYGFKPIKRRETMISLLVQCWECMSGRKLASGKEQDRLPSPGIEHQTEK